MTRDNSNSKLKKMGRTKRPKLERYKRARLQQADIEAVGLALKGDLISPEQALELLADCDVLRLVGTPPEAQA
jgi:hypothetical protein